MEGQQTLDLEDIEVFAESGILVQVRVCSIPFTFSLENLVSVSISHQASS